MSQRKIGLGYTEEGCRVVATIAIDYSDGALVTFTDHSERPAPDCISVTWEVTRPNSRMIESAGQVPPEDRVIARRHARDATPEVREFIEQLWLDHHLNDMHAECEHMTTEMLSKRDGETGSEWQKRMLETVVCPLTGYRWGRAWLAREVPVDVLTRTARLIETGA